MALPPLGRAPRRGQTGAREHLGGIPPGRAARLPHVRMRRQTQQRRRGVLDARRDAQPHHQRPRRGRGPVVARLGATGRRQLALTRLCGRAAAHAGQSGPLLPPQPLPAEHRNQTHARHRTTHGRSGGPRGCGAVGGCRIGQRGGHRDRALVDFVPTRSLGWRESHSAKCAARLAARQLA